MHWAGPRVWVYLEWSRSKKNVYACQGDYQVERKNTINNKCDGFVRLALNQNTHVPFWNTNSFVISTIGRRHKINTKKSHTNVPHDLCAMLFILIQTWNHSSESCTRVGTLGRVNLFLRVRVGPIGILRREYLPKKPSKKKFQIFVSH